MTLASLGWGALAYLILGVLAGSQVIRMYFPGGQIDPLAVLLVLLFWPLFFGLMMLHLFVSPIIYATMYLAGYRRSRDGWRKRCPTCGSDC